MSRRNVRRSTLLAICDYLELERIIQIIMGYN